MDTRGHSLESVRVSLEVPPGNKRLWASSKASHIREYLVEEEREQDALPSRSILVHLATFFVGFTVGLLFLAATHLAAVDARPAVPQARPLRMPLPPISDSIDPSSNAPAAWFSGPCGGSPAEASRANCTLDLLSFSWRPSACVTPEDRRDEEEFLALEEWTYERADGSEVSDEEALVGPADKVSDLRARLRADIQHPVAARELRFVYTSGRWHRVHCAFMFRRLQRKLVRGQAVDSYVASDGHATHCRHVLVDAHDMWEWERKGASVRTRVWLKYPECI